MYLTGGVLEYELHSLIAEETSCPCHEGRERVRKVQRYSHEREHVAGEPGHKHGREEHLQAERLAFYEAVQVPRDPAEYGEERVHELYLRVAEVREYDLEVLHIM